MFLPTNTLSLLCSPSLAKSFDAVGTYRILSPKRGFIFCLKGAKMKEDEKRCSKCGETKPLDEFYKDKTAKGGYRYNCKGCCKAYERTPEGKEVHRRYKRSKKGKESNKRYGMSEKGKIKDRRHANTEKGKATRTRFFSNS